MSQRCYGALLLLLLACLLPTSTIQAQPANPSTFCFGKPWRPSEIKLKDHTLFRYNGMFYMASISLPQEENGPRYEEVFAYARTKDFCSWEYLGPILGLGSAGEPDEFRIWAPHVISFGTTWYMFYTGVNKSMAQTIMLATSTNPADPKSWTRQGPVFQPTHEGALYPGSTAWSDARDPMVFYDWVGRRYIMYYTGVDQAGCPNGLQICGIIGTATAARLDGPWQDDGAILRLRSAGVPESPYLVAPGFGGVYYLFYNHATRAGDGGQKVVTSLSPTGPWSASEQFSPGWGSDFFQASEAWVMSYLGNYTIGVTRLSWDATYSPARPSSGRQVHLPFVVRLRQR